MPFFCASMGNHDIRSFCTSFLVRVHDILFCFFLFFFFPFFSFFFFFFVLSAILLFQSEKIVKHFGKSKFTRFTCSYQAHVEREDKSETRLIKAVFAELSKFVFTPHQHFLSVKEGSKTKISLTLNRTTNKFDLIFTKSNIWSTQSCRTAITEIADATIYCTEPIRKSFTKTQNSSGCNQWKTTTFESNHSPNNRDTKPPPSYCHQVICCQRV